MCGIIGYIGFQNPKGVLLDGLKRLEYRGYDSAGIAVLEPKGVQVYRCEGRIAGLEKRLTDKVFEGTLGIGHTRWATHGAPTETNAHPHQVGAITLVHNGIIENYLEHRAAIQAMHRTLSSETDSEIVAHLFDNEIQKGKYLREAVTAVVPLLRGSYAFVVVSDKEPDLLIGVRNGAPLLVGLGEKENYIASDVQAILQRISRIIYLKNQQLAICTREGVEVTDLKGRSAPFEVKQIHWTAEQMEKAGYRHYMLKEIHEQPQALAQTIEAHLDHAKSLIEIQNAGLSVDQLRAIKHIRLIACGTARHAALVGQYYLERLARVSVSVDYASEFRYRDPILEPGTLLVFVSQSGETADTLAALHEGKERGFPTLAICNVRESSLAREADHVIYTNAGPEIGVASTKAFTTQLAVLCMFAIQLGHARGVLPTAYARELTQDLLRLPTLIQGALEKAPEMEKMALEYLDLPFFFYMGREVLYPIALEGALKLKEISYAHAEGYAAGELKHGPIALIDRSTLILALAPFDQKPHHADASVTERSARLHEKMMSNLQEVKSRGGKVVSFITEGQSHPPDPSERTVALPSASWALNPIVLSVPLQLFAYYMALHRGTDVDKPRNLAKSVTVE